ncbi:MAG: hypothetical protein WAT39_04390 [Planctomycetota bacterium]
MTRTLLDFVAIPWCVVAAFAASLVPVMDALAQDAVRSFGTYCVATDCLPAADIDADGDSMVLLRTDGRVFVIGYAAPVDVPVPPVGVSYVGVQMGGSSARFALALRSDGTIAGWGTSTSVLPPPAPAPGTSWVQVSAGGLHAVALRSDGVAVAWGSNIYGQTNLPVVPPGVTVVRVFAGFYSTLLLLSNGRIVACGTQALVTVPRLQPGVTYTEMWASAGFAVARRSDGVYVAWGENGDGQLGLPSLPPGVTFVTMGLGWRFGVALRSDGVLVGWGNNDYGQRTPPLLPPGAVVAQIAAAGTYTAFRLADGSVTTVGFANNISLIPTLAAGDRWVQASAGLPLLLLAASGLVVPVIPMFGLPVPALPAGMSYVAVSAGYQHSVALRSDGRAIAWGQNGFGQCAIPPLPPGLVYQAAVAGWGRTALRRSDGVVVECGNSGVPTIPPPLAGTTYVQFDLGGHGSAQPSNSTVLLRSDGGITMVFEPYSSLMQPPALPAGLSWRSVALGNSFASALRSDGTVVAWGYPLSTPLPALPAGVSYVQVAADTNQLIGRRSDGRVAVGGSYGVFPAPLWPGESFVDVSVGGDSFLVRVGPTSTYVTYGNGCAGTRPASRLVPHDTPAIGMTHRVTVLDLPQSLAVMVFGWNRVAPVSLGALGLSGCFQHVAIDGTAVITGSANNAMFEIPIPAVLSLIGVSFTNQAIVFDPGANPLGLVVSDAAEGVIGRH